MKFEILDAIIGNIDGASFAGLDTETVVKLTGGKKNSMQGRITKKTVGSNVLVFTNKSSNGYMNMVRKRLEEEGKNPDDFSMSPRKWGERIPNSPYVKHGEKRYLEVVFIRSGKSTYHLDGEHIDADDIEGLPTEKKEGAQGGLDNKVIIRTYDIENITGLRANGYIINKK